MLLAFLDQGHWLLTLTFDLSSLHLSRNIPLFIYNFPTKIQHHWTFLDEVTGKNSIFRQSSLTIDLWPWVDLTQNLITSSTCHGAPLGQVW